MNNVEDKKENNKIHILIVDDDGGFRVMLEAYLLKRGFKVSIAANGLHALQKIQAPNDLNFILTDLKMSGMDGIEFLKKLNQIKKMPCFLMTGFSEKEKILSAMKLGVHGVFVKPFSFDDLVEKIKLEMSKEAA
jgi:DNA-binding NtrC family response regulator